MNCVQYIQLVELRLVSGRKVNITTQSLQMSHDHTLTTSNNIFTCTHAKQAQQYLNIDTDSDT